MTPTTVRWRIAGMLMALCFISHFNRASMSVAGTDRIIDEFDITPVQMGTVYSAFLVIYSLCMIPGGIFIDRFGPRKALMVVGFSSAILGALTGFVGFIFLTGASLILGLKTVRGNMGALSAPLHPAAARAIGNWFPFAERSLANGLVTAAAILGVAASYPGFGALIKWVDWQWAFVIAGAITAALTWIWAIQSRDWPGEHPAVNEAEKRHIGTSPQEESAEQGDWLALLRNPSLILVTLSYASVGYFQYLFVYWIQYYFTKVLNVGADASKMNAGFLQLSLAIGMPLGGWLAGRLTKSLGVRRGRALVAGGGMILSAGFLGVAILMKDPVWIVRWLALAHAAIGASEAAFWATAVDIGGSKGGTSAAICNTGGNVGGLLAPTLTPWIAEKVNWTAGIGLGGLICFLGALCWIWIKPQPAPNQK